MSKRCKKCKVPLELHTLLAEGYTEMAGEAIKITREFEKLDDEVAKYLDKKKRTGFIQ